MSEIHILIAEDNDVSRNMMAAILEGAGYIIHHARDGGEAIDKLIEAEMDMCFVDINMAPQGGFEFIRHMIARDIDIPVTIVTGDTSSDMLLEVKSLGVHHVIQKPIKPDILLKTVERVIARRARA